MLQRQRNLIYETRANLLSGAKIEEKKLLEIAGENIKTYLDQNRHLERSELNRYILDNISYSLDGELDHQDLSDHKSVEHYLMQRVRQGLAGQRARIGNAQCYEQFVREATLAAVDDGWVELIDYLEQFKYAVSGRASAQRNVMFEYQNEAFDSYLDTEKVVKRNIIRNILLSDVKPGKNNQPVIIYP